MRWLLFILVVAPWGLEPSVELRAPPGVLSPAERGRWEAACRDAAAALGGMPARRWQLSVERTRDPGDFAARTGRARFEAAAVSGGRLILQSRAVLARFARLQRVRRHECVHAWLRAAGIPPLPPILEELVAVGISGQAAGLPPAEPLKVGELPALRAEIARPRSRPRYRRLLARAVQTFWPALRRLSPKQRAGFLRQVGARPQQWLTAPLPGGGSLQDALRTP